MKSEFADRETIGSLLNKTQEEHEKSASMEVGDLVREFGKQYMIDLYDYVEKGSKTFDRFYINILSRKTRLFNNRAIEVFPYIQKTLPFMQENQDVWFIDCKKQEVKLLWTLPEKSEFDIILANPTKDNEQVIHWIKAYLKLEKKTNSFKS